MSWECTGCGAIYADNPTVDRCPACEGIRFHRVHNAPTVIDDHLIETLGAIEADPHGLDPHTPGAKLDAHKPRTGLVLLDFSHALTEVAHVGTFGATKYTDHGWLSVPNGRERYTDALFRHLLANEPYDPDSGLLHAAHAAWNALARLELQLRQ